MNIAKEMPRNEGELAAIPRLPASWSRGGRFKTLQEAVTSALDQPEALLPEVRRPQARRGSKPFEERLRQLCKRRDGLARELGLEPALLASRAVLGQALSNIERGEAPEEVPDLRVWQAELLRPVFEGLET
jgi:hypothetical protein